MHAEQERSLFVANSFSGLKDPLKIILIYCKMAKYDV